MERGAFIPCAQLWARTSRALSGGTESKRGASRKKKTNWRYASVRVPAGKIYGAHLNTFEGNRRHPNRSGAGVSSVGDARCLLGGERCRNSHGTEVHPCAAAERKALSLNVVRARSAFNRAA